MSEYLLKIKELSLDIVNKHQKELVDVKVRKEFGTNIISIVIDDPETFSLDIDEVASINSEILDKVNDLIPDGYYLEVTSLGIERELLTEKDIQKAINKFVYLKTYQKMENVYNLKEISGYLREANEEEFKLEIFLNQREKVVVIPRAAVAKIRLAVDFRRN
ncbi:MAG: ribosome maturation factor RimP [Bacilli bacterium]|jgi:ribosome maturation factor rimP|nr:ribosome maturation factor RimP [Staphylococcus sp.]